ncbi:hypothetical protein BDA96_10G316400 [Sorghum bicolor]|uniref:Uncharacterized protein n=1 Tax=Sorghum bicolor TaxID=4558 RepID=A0A921Q861_SORBI|nr:hypothetical protein BDA96_10G316400 [Sorghum bicolor]
MSTAIRSDSPLLHFIKQEACPRRAPHNPSSVYQCGEHLQRGLAVHLLAHFLEQLEGVQEPTFLAVSIHPHAVRHGVRHEAPQHGIMVEEVQRVGVSGLLEPEQQRVERARVGRRWKSARASATRPRAQKARSSALSSAAPKALPARAQTRAAESKQVTAASKDAPGADAESAVERRTASAGVERRCGCVDGRDSSSGNERWAWRRERARRRRRTGRELSGTEKWRSARRRRYRESAGSGGECERRRWERSGVRRAGQAGRSARRSGGVSGAWARRRRARWGTVGVRSGAAARRGGGRRRRGMGRGVVWPARRGMAGRESSRWVG